MKSSQEKGRGNSTHGKKCFLVSLGCPKNRVDSEWVREELSRAGYGFVEAPEDADVLLVNTCSFIQDAVVESVDAVLEAVEMRRESGRADKVVVLGCLPQRFGRDLAGALPEVDLFVGCSELNRIVDLLSNDESESLFVSDKASFLPSGPFLRTPSLGLHTAYVKVSEGCSRKCSFCVVPSIRGPGRSRPMKDIVEEVEDFANRGVKEINLVAQDLTAYGVDLDGKVDLSRLLMTIGGIDGLRWIRPLYLYPSAVTQRLLETMASIPTIAPYLDIPLQHVSEPVLEAMSRGYGERTVNRLMERIRKYWPQAFVRTTLLVGHPGETDEAYTEVETFLKRWKLEHVGVFAYSPEDGTVAAEMDRPPLNTAKRRRDRCMKIQRGISRENLRTLRGKIFNVLIDGPSEESEHIYTGRHAGQAPEIDGVVYVTEDRRESDGAPRLKSGDWVDVEIGDTGDYDLTGSVIVSERI